MTQVNLFFQVQGYYVGEKAAIEALAGLAEGSLGYATDTDEFGSYNGSVWAWGGGGGLTTEQVQDIIGAMLSGNTETGITVTYQDADGTIDFELSGALLAANNLSDLLSSATARTNLGLGNSAVRDIGQITGTVASGERGVDGGNTHDHFDGSGAQVDHANLTGLTTGNPHTQYQPIDADLTAIAGLSPANDDIIQRKTGAWINRTLTQLWTDLKALTGFPIGGTWTPTATGVANVDAVTPFASRYSRADNIITCSGRVNVDATTGSTLTRIRLSLPVASPNLGTDDLAGTLDDGAAIDGLCFPDTTNKEAELRFTPTSTANRSYYFIFQYEVK